MIRFINRILNFAKIKIWYALNVHRYGKLGYKSFINSPLKLEGRQNIYLEDNVIVSYKSWLASMPLTGSDKPSLTIGRGTIIGNFNHIYATKSISIGQNVLTADKVYISDNLHSFDDINTPIMHQPIKQIKEVKIGDGSWLGENVCVIGACIGKNSVIGANSVVTSNIPDFCVAVGIPARIIKQYNPKTSSWDKVTG